MMNPSREDFESLLNESFGTDSVVEGSVVKGRITAIEKNKWPGVVVRDLPEPLYILEVESGSPGMGPAGFDLAIIYVADRSKLDKA